MYINRIHNHLLSTFYIISFLTDFLYGLSHVQRIVLSNNSISSLHTGFMSNLKDVQLLDLSHNAIDNVATELSEVLGRAATVDLTFNQIYAIEAGENSEWRHLNLAHNNFKTLTDDVFKSSQLETLDLSFNALVTIEADAFTKLKALRVLKLTSNELRDLSLVLPDSVEDVNLGNNSLRLWPLKHVPSNLTRLDVHGNELSEIFPGHDAVHNLKVRN